MTIGDRIKEFRKIHNLTQAEFAEKIGLKQAVIGMYENGTRNIIDRNITLICEKFGLSEAWLRTGEGEMYVQTDDTLFTKLSKEYNLSVGMQELLRAILDLDDERREQLVDFAVYFNSRLAPATETSATVSDIDKQVADYRKELEAEQKGQLALQNLGEEKKA